MPDPGEAGMENGHKEKNFLENTLNTYIVQDCSIVQWR